MENLTHKLELITEAVDFIKHKVDNVSNHMGAVSGMITNLVEKFVVNKLSQKLEERVEKKKRK